MTEELHRMYTGHALLCTWYTICIQTWLFSCDENRWITFVSSKQRTVFICYHSWLWVYCQLQWHGHMFRKRHSKRFFPFGQEGLCENRLVLKIAKARPPDAPSHASPDSDINGRSNYFSSISVEIKRNRPVNISTTPVIPTFVFVSMILPPLYVPRFVFSRLWSLQF